MHNAGCEGSASETIHLDSTPPDDSREPMPAGDSEK
jgi:hypothetical protein